MVFLKFNNLTLFQEINKKLVRTKTDSGGYVNFTKIWY